MDVLWESRRKDDQHTWSGLTDNYIRVTTRNERNLANTITPTRLTDLVEGEMYGEVEKEIEELRK